jgi:hypothetical protein
MLETGQYIDVTAPVFYSTTCPEPFDELRIARAEGFK